MSGRKVSNSTAFCRHQFACSVYVNTTKLLTLVGNVLLLDFYVLNQNKAILRNINYY